MYANSRNNYHDYPIYDDVWCRTLLRITPLCLFTGLVAASLKHWITAISEIAVFISSQLHWRNPRHSSYLRNIDIVVVQISLFVHLLAIWNAEAWNAFIAMTVAIMCFGWSQYRNSYPHHAAGWIISCLSNLLLARTRYLISFKVNTI